MLHLLRRSLRAGFIALGLGWSAWASAATSDGLPPMEVQKVGKDVYVVQGQSGAASSANAGFISNAGAVATGEGLVVFDTLGTPALAAKMRKLIEEASGEKTKIVVVSHYHADHFYGIQAFAGPGVDIIAHPNSPAVFNSENTQRRLEERRQDLFPWVSEQTHLVAPTRLAKITPTQNETFQLGRYHFTLIDALGAHAPDEMMMRVEELGVVFAGDLFFTGRVPFVGDADPKVWLAALDHMSEKPPKIAIPGHGAVSYEPDKDLGLTHRYLGYLATQMAAAVAKMQSFDEAYNAIDWSEFKDLPAFGPANRLNAMGAYLNAEKDSLDAK